MSPSIAAAGPVIGPWRLNSPFVQAALSGYSDRPMRVLAREFGASYTLAEVMIERFVNEVRGSGRTAHHLRIEEGDHPVGGQLMGSDPAAFAPAARRLVAAGFDVIDINFGCPVKSAIGGCRGGFHLSQPRVALEIVDRVRNATPPEIPVTLKMRRGIDKTLESRDRFFAILNGAFERGAAAITVHGRTVEQRYRGPSDWSFLREVKAIAGERTILGSGDLFDATACNRMLQETGVDGVTIARGAIGNPWIFQEALALWNGDALPDPPSVAEQRRVLEQHRDLAEDHDPRGWVSAMRKAGFKYAPLHPGGDAVRNAFASVKDRASWDALMHEHYACDAPGVRREVLPSASAGENCSSAEEEA